jgi:DNA-binding NtrC family response regulator
VQGDDQLEPALAGVSTGPGRAVLIVEPSPDQQARLARLTSVSGHRAVATSTLDGARAFLGAFPVDLVLLSEELAGSAPLPIVAEMVGRRPGARVVIMTQPKGPGGEIAEAPTDALEYVSRALGPEQLRSLIES